MTYDRPKNFLAPDMINDFRKLNFLREQKIETRGTYYGFSQPNTKQGLFNHRWTQMHTDFKRL